MGMETAGQSDNECSWHWVSLHWPPDAKSWLPGRDPDAGKDWRREEKGTTEDEMVGWHRRLDGHELEQAPGVGDGQGSLACYGPWGRKESDRTEKLNNNDKVWGSGVPPTIPLEWLQCTWVHGVIITHTHGIIITQSTDWGLTGRWRL